MNLAPIALFAYRRVDSLRLVIDALRLNALCPQSKLYLFSDGAKGDLDKHDVQEVREYIRSIEGFKSIEIHESDVNKGLARSIIEGVGLVLSSNDSIIVLEDDLLTSRNFLDFLNYGLNRYSNQKRIMSICAFGFPLRNSSDYDVYMNRRTMSYGWATWRDRWINVDWEVSDYEAFKSDGKFRREFNKMGSDLSHMLHRQKNGRIDSWYIRWCYHQYKYNLLSVHPYVSKVSNIGFDSDRSTHTKEPYNRFKTPLDISDANSFRFPEKIFIDEFASKQFVSKFSIVSRIKYRLINEWLRFLKGK